MGRNLGQNDRRLNYVPVSGTFRTVFNVQDSSRSSAQLIRFSGSQDATYRIFSSNFGPDESIVQGVQSLIGNKYQQLTGSAHDPYWTLELTGTFFTGSATIPPTPATEHFADIGTQLLMIEVSSSFGGPYILRLHGKE